MANEETVTKVVEGVDRLFDEIVVNGRTVKSAPARQSAGSTSVSTNQSEPPVQGEYVKAIQLNNILHDIKDAPLTQEVLAIQQAINILQGRLDDLITSVGNINAKIPAQASSTNQLADKNFVNSSIATNTANFLGTYSTLAEIEAIPDPTNNDYAFLETADASGNNLYDRYKYSAEDGEWLFEYELNNSSFTAEQWATINSGLTQSSVETLVNDEVAEALASPSLKQPIFDFCHPVGETYTQYPEQLDPVTLYNQNGIQSTWILLDYGGAFFRAEGGNALAFNNSKEVTAVSGAVLTIPSSGASVGCLIYDPVGNETRTVTAVSGNSVTVNSAFTSPNLTNVLIGQSYQSGYHSHSIDHGHSITDPKHSHTYTRPLYNNTSAGSTTTKSATYDTASTSKVATGITVNNHTGNSGYSGGSSTDKETRTTNMTIRVWKRTV